MRCSRTAIRRSVGRRCPLHRARRQHRRSRIEAPVPTGRGLPRAQGDMAVHAARPRHCRPWSSSSRRKRCALRPKQRAQTRRRLGPPPVHTQRRCVGGRRSSHALASSQFGLASCGCCCCRAQCRGGSGYAPEVPTQCERRRRQREACRMQHATWCAANTATWLSTRFGMRNVGTHRGHILCALKTLTV